MIPLCGGGITELLKTALMFFLMIILALPMEGILLKGEDF